MFVVVCGLPGVGKTTVARTLADRLDGRVHRTDVVRKDLDPDPDYSDEETRAVYDELLDRGRRTVRDGDPAVFDGTFGDATHRRRVRRLAADCDVDCRFVKVECDESVVRDRIAARTDDESDADFSVYRLHREAFDPLSTDHATVDNSDGLDETRRQVADLL